MRCVAKKRKGPRLLSTVVGTVLLCCSMSAPCTAQISDPATLQKLKVAFLFNFSKFIRWPEDTLQPQHFNICVEQDEELSTAILALNGKSTEQREIRVVNTNERGFDPANCQILYSSKQDVFLRLSSVLTSKPVLSVSDDSSLTIISFVEKEEKLKFVIRLENAKRVGLQISAQLLRLAEIQ